MSLSTESFGPNRIDLRKLISSSERIKNEFARTIEEGYHYDKLMMPSKMVKSSSMILDDG